MKSDNFANVSFSPSIIHLSQIESWLIEEQNTSGEGFYCNWDIIKSSYEDNRMAVIFNDSQAIGFVIWQVYSQYIATIDIAEIHPKERKKGLGKQLIGRLIEDFISKNVCAISLQCAPAESETIWRHLGFVDFPEKGYYWNGRNKHLYKIIVPHLSQQIADDDKDFIELWDDEPYRTQSLVSTWKWALRFRQGTSELESPIIHPCHSDWRLRFIKNNLTVKDDKVKYFGKTEVVFGNFLILKHLN